jgi:mRNA interferase MazF
VLSPIAYNGVVGLALVVPITSKVKGYNFEVPLPDTLETHGVILSDQIRSFDWRARSAAFQETVPSVVFDEVIARVAALLNLT